jgi:branched-chain amino acid transport system permease protein
MLQRLCSQDYRSLAAMGTGWPPIAFFGRSWPPGSIATWIVPVALLSAAAALGWAARRGMTSTSAQAPDAAAARSRTQVAS